MSDLCIARVDPGPRFDLEVAANRIHRPLLLEFEHASCQHWAGAAEPDVAMWGTTLGGEKARRTRAAAAAAYGSSSSRARLAWALAAAPAASSSSHTGRSWWRAAAAAPAARGDRKSVV